MKPSSLSSIIINWNTKEHLEGCVQSFLREGVSRRHIIVVDQASTDGSVTMMRKRFPNIKVIRTENLGYAHAANLGMKEVDTDLAAISNADITLHKGCLSEVEKEFGKDERIGLTGSSVYDASGNKVTRFSRTSVRRGIALELIPRTLRGTWRTVEQHIYRRQTPFDVTYVEGAFMVVRRDIYNDLGGMDEGFSFFYEDADLPMRMRKAGFRVVHVPTASVTHAGGASFSQVPIRHATEFYRNMIRLYRRHALRRALWLRRALIVVFRTKRAILRVIRFFHTNAAAGIMRSTAILQSLGRPTNSTGQGEMNPLVSVIVPTYRRPDRIKMLLTALRGQSYGKFEVVIVDQSEEKRKPTLPKIRQRVLQLRTGYPNRSAAKNAALLQARGSILLFCDDDITPEKNFVETHVQCHTDGHIGGVSCRTVEEGRADVHTKDICRVRWHGEVIDRFQSDVTCSIKTLVGGNMSIKRTAMMEAGYFDTLYRGTSIFEEPDISDRLRSLGYSLLFTNASTVRHCPQSNGNVGTRTRYPSSYYHDFHHNEIVYFLKNRNHLLLPFVICFCFLRSVKQSIRYGLSFGQGLHMFMGVPAGFRSYVRSLK